VREERTKGAIASETKTGFLTSDNFQKKRGPEPDGRTELSPPIDCENGHLRTTSSR